MYKYREVAAALSVRVELLIAVVWLILAEVELVLAACCCGDASTTVEVLLVAVVALIIVLMLCCVAVKHTNISSNQLPRGNSTIVVPLEKSTANTSSSTSSKNWHAEQLCSSNSNRNGNITSSIILVVSVVAVVETATQ